MQPIQKRGKGLFTPFNLQYRKKTGFHTAFLALLLVILMILAYRSAQQPPKGMSIHPENNSIPSAP